MNCDCSRYEPLELIRKAITRRIKGTPVLMRRLHRIASTDEQQLFFYKCPECGQYWQTGHEWNFANKEYLFQVPQIEVAEWQREPYAQPAAMLIYSAVMREFEARGKFEESENQCSEPARSRRFGSARSASNTMLSRCVRPSCCRRNQRGACFLRTMSKVRANKQFSRQIRAQCEFAAELRRWGS